MFDSVLFLLLIILIFVSDNTSSVYFLPYFVDNPIKETFLFLKFYKAGKLRGFENV